MGLISSIASIFGANSQKKAVERASNEQLAYTQKGIDALNTAGQTGLNALQTGATSAADILSGQAGDNTDLIHQLMASFQPFAESGVNAQTNGVNPLLGLAGPEAQDEAIARLSASPQFQRLLGAGQNGILANASATGGLRGGNVQEALAEFSSGLLGDTIQKQLDRLSGVASQGLTATANAANGALGGAQLNSGLANDQASILQGLGINTANLTAEQARQIASLFGDQGAARAGGILGKSAATQKMIQGGAQAAGDIASAFAGGSGQIGSTIAKFI